MAILFSLVIKTPKIDDDEDLVDNEEDIVLQYDEDWLHDDRTSKYAYKTLYKPHKNPNLA